MSQRVVKVLAPRANDRDVLAAELFLATLRDVGPLALEIVGQPHGCSLQLRGNAEAVTHAIAQLHHTYPQCEIVEVSPTDDITKTSASIQHCVELRLRDVAYLPIRSYVAREGRVGNDDFASAADPLIGVLASLAGLRANEGCLVQFVLRPLPSDWGKAWRGATRDVGERAKTTPQAIGALLLLVLGISGLGWGGLIGLLAVLLPSDFSLWLAAILLLIIGVGLLIWRARLPSPPDPNLIRHKINQPAFRVWLRLFTFGDDDATCIARMRRLVSAFGAYTLAGGNGFEPLALHGNLSPSAIHLTDDPNTVMLPGVGLLRKPLHTLPILNISELAGLWHVPHSTAGYQGLAMVAGKRLDPSPSQLAQTDGVLLGHSAGCEVRLSRAQLRGNIGLVAKTQSGKSNLMSIITADVIANDPDACVIVIDPHRDLVRNIAAQLPPQRLDKAIYWSLADTERPFGLNLLEVSRLSPDIQSDTLIAALREIWSDFWGPRMEDNLRWPLLTLTNVNAAMLTDWAFTEWLSQTRQAIIGLRERRVDVDRAIFDTYRAFAQLGAPTRPSVADAYGACLKLYADYDAAHKAGLRGEANAKAVKLAAIQVLSQTILALNVSPRSGVVARRYNDPSRPLQYTLLDIEPMHLSATFRREALACLPEAQHSHIRAWWRQFDSIAQINPRQLLEMINPVHTKLNRFAASDTARRIFGQPESTLDLAQVLNEGRVLLIDLAAGAVGSDTAALVGATLLNWLAALLFAQGQANVGGASASVQRRRVFIVVDEFQSIPGADYAQMLSEFAKYGAQLMLGTQSLGVLEEKNRLLRKSWLDNTHTLFAFRSGSDDARTLADELSIGELDPLTVTSSDIVGLPDYTCYVRSRDTEHGQQVFRLHTRRADAGSEHTYQDVAAQSRERYGRDAKQVDTWLALARKYRGQPDLFGDSTGRKPTSQPPSDINSADLPRPEPVIQ